ERIHRTNLIGMGVLPLEFTAGTTRETLGIDGTETFDVTGIRSPGAALTLVINRTDGSSTGVPVTCRLDSDEEVLIYEAGGVLQRFAQDFLAANTPAGALDEQPSPRPAAENPRHLHARRHLQGRVLPPRRPARSRAHARPGARRAADARDRLARPLWQAHRRHGRRDLVDQQVRDHRPVHAARARRRLSLRPGVDRHRL